MNSRTIFKSLCLATGLLLLSINAFAWGQKGHDTTCLIAERHLTRKAKKQIDAIFEGKSIVYWANWMDNASHQPEYAYTKTWHYKNIDANETYETAMPNEAGDVVTAISAQIAALKSGELNPEAQAIALRMLVHLVGDLHCPMHMGHKSDSGGNRWQVRFFNEGTNIHSVWDSKIVDSAHKWTFTEWAEQVDRADKKQIAAITSGTLDDWGKETCAVCTQVYDETPVGSMISYNEVERWTPVIEEQFLKGGLRLAAILNDIFK